MSIASEISRIQQAKADIKTAIEAKGVTVPSSATIDTYDDYVSQISGGGGSTADTQALIDLIERDITSIDIPTGTTSIGDNAFTNCTSLTSITIPDSVISVGVNVFNGCTSLPVDDYIRYADTYAVAVTDKTLSTYTIKSGTKFLGDYSFDSVTGMTSITIPNGVLSIGENAFRNCKGLTSITIPDSVTWIAKQAFYTCPGLTSVTIGNSVTTIGSYAFRNCSGLTSITCLATTPPTLANVNAFNNTNNCPIYVPSGSVSAYQTAWSDYASRIQAIPNS